MIYRIKDPEDLAQAGWGAIVSVSGEVREAIRPLLNYRREQASAYQESRYRELDFLAGETKISFLTRHGESPGPLRAGSFPYYWLIIGDPEDIPFSFQYQLGVRHRVGRIHFDTADGYENYARNVIDAETECQRAKNIDCFVVDNPQDPGLKVLNEHLSRPLIESLRNHSSGWSLEFVLAEAATKSRLGELLMKRDSPGLLFIAAHGVSWPRNIARQRKYQGSVICSDWPGHGTPSFESIFGAPDVPAGTDLRGKIIVYFGSYSAGTCWKEEVEDIKRIRGAGLADISFVAPLAKELLGRKKGALALLGHVNTGWQSSFYWKGAGSQIQTFDAAFDRLQAGYRVGSALECFSQRYAEIAADILSHSEAQTGTNDSGIEFLRFAACDAKQYVLVGDPASRLALSRRRARASPRGGV